MHDPLDPLLADGVIDEIVARLRGERMEKKGEAMEKKGL